MDTLEFKRPYFSPPEKPKEGAATKVANRNGEVYVYTDEIILAVNAALAAQRPLLITGEPGTGKSTLAQNVALVKGWRFYRHVVTSRTEARDLLWSFDALRRLHDAQLARPEALKPVDAYLQAGKLWLAFMPPATEIKEDDSPHAVVLLDEIDKADPDVPNDLLGVLGEGRFEVTDTRQEVKWNSGERQVLVILTSNGERSLSPAFVRRCIHLRLAFPGEKELVEIAQTHLGPAKQNLYLKLAKRLLADRQTARREGLRPPSTAEYLDVVVACRELGIGPDDPTFKSLSSLVLSKRVDNESASLPEDEPA